MAKTTILYTDTTILTWGKYKFTSLSRIPASFFIELHQKNNCHDKALMIYIEDNLDAIKARLDGNSTIPEAKCSSGKKTYVTEKVAKEELRRVVNTIDDNKKPKRTYECDICGGWHFTSMSLSAWKKLHPSKK